MPGMRSTATAEVIVADCGADDVMTAIKDNPPTMLAQRPAMPWDDSVSVHETFDQGHGRRAIGGYLIKFLNTFYSMMKNTRFYLLAIARKGGFFNRHYIETFAEPWPGRKESRELDCRGRIYSDSDIRLGYRVDLPSQ